MNRFMVFSSLVLLMLAIPLGEVKAQSKISGVVVDSATSAPLPGVNVMLVRGKKTVKFTQSNANGSFTLDVPEIKGGDSLQVTALGYQKKRQILEQNTLNRIGMVEKAFQLNEVVVQSGPVTGRGDTVTYDLTRFANGRDNTLKDVLKKLPGVVVSKSGQISYNGRALSRFTVEGLDLSGGRYNQLTENIKATDVKKAEVIEHDQPIKALRHKVASDDVAMNVVLKDSVRDRFSFILTPYLMAGSPTHAAGDAHVMQMGKRRQMMYQLDYDRSGKDIAAHNHLFYFDYGSLSGASLPSWYNVPALASPIDAERLRFNTSQRYSASVLTKTKEEKEHKVTACYTRNVLRQRTGNSSLYYLNDTPVLTTEKRNMMLNQDLFNFSYNRKINEESSYGNFKVVTDVARNDALSQLESAGHGITWQRTRTPEAHFLTSIYKLFSLAKSTLTWKSIADYHYSRNNLYLDTLGHLSLSNNLWHTAHAVSWMKKKQYFTQSYSADVDVQGLKVQHNNTLLAFSLSPSWIYERGKWRVSLYQSVKLSHYFHQHQSFISPATALSAYFKRDNRLEWNASLNYLESLGNFSDFALDSYQGDYRTFYCGADFVPRNRSLSMSLRGEYKRPLYEFFANARILACRFWQNSMIDMSIVDGNYYYSRLRHSTHTQAMNGECNISKGFYRLHMKTSITIAAGYMSGQSFSQGKVRDHDYRSLSFKPSVSFYPSWMQFDYDGDFGLGQSQVEGVKLNALFNWTQRFTITSTMGAFDLSLAMVCYHNELHGSPSVNTLLADAQAVWRLSRVRLKAQLRNIFNKKRYVTATYSGIGSFTNEYELRPREFMLSAQFHF